MKITQLSIWVCASMFFLTSCTEAIYNVIETTPLPDEQKETEQAQITIDYNLWSLGGKLELTVQNNTGVPIYIDWLQSSLSINSTSFIFYQPTTFQNTSSTVSTSITDIYYQQQSKGNSRSVSMGINRIEIIPPFQSISKTFFEHQLTSNIKDCELKLQRNSIDKISYDETSTPIVFSIMVATCNNVDGQSPKFYYDNFYVNNVSVMTAQQFRGRLQTSESCDGRTVSTYPYSFKDDGNYYFSSISESGNSRGKGGKSNAGLLVVISGLLVGGIAIASTL